MKIKQLASALGCLALLGISGTAKADLLSDIGGSLYTNGSYGNWDPNVLVPRTENGVTGGVTWVEGNNTIPNNADYGPGPAGEEPFDLEFLAWRVVNNQLQIMGVTSINQATGVVGNSGNTFHLGDIFMSTGNGAGFNGYSYALATGTYTTNLLDPLHPGDTLPINHNQANGLYQIGGADDVRDVTTVANGGATGFGTGDLAAQSDPFAIRNTPGTVANANVGYSVTQITDNNGDPTNAPGSFTDYVYQWTIDLSDPGVLAALTNGSGNFDSFSLHWTIECGNDFLDTTPVVPEPATLSLLGLGLATAGMLRRRKKVC